MDTINCSKCGKEAPATTTKTGRPHKRCEKCREVQARGVAAYRERKGGTAKEYQRQFHEKRRRLVVDHYGGKCICCGEGHWQFLALDHKEGGGNAHRREVQQRGNSMVGWIIANDFPPMFEIRCHNCNQARGFYGVCPHELE